MPTKMAKRLDTKAAQAGRLTSLLRQIDRLGDLRSRQHALQLEERALTLLVKDEMRDLKLASAEARTYHADLVEQRRLRVADVAAFRKAAGDRLFLQCVSVQIAQARRLLGEAALEKLAVADTAELLEVRPREGRSLAEVTGL